MKRVCLFGIFVFIVSFSISNVAWAGKPALCIFNPSAKKLTYSYSFQQKTYTGSVRGQDSKVIAEIPEDRYFNITLSDDKGKKVYSVKRGNNLHYLDDIKKVEIDSTPFCGAR